MTTCIRSFAPESQTQGFYYAMEVLQFVRWTAGEYSLCDAGAVQKRMVGGMVEVLCDTGREKAVYI